MRNERNTTDYFLFFAINNELGLKKMKEAMWRIEASGTYSFSDAIDPSPKCPKLIAPYKRQLCTYAHILERRHSRQVNRLLLYWAFEARKENALMVLPYDSRRERKPADILTKPSAESGRGSSQ